MKIDAQRWGQLLGAEGVSTLRSVGRPVAGLAGETPVVAPNELAGVQEALRFAQSERLRVLPAGALEHLAWGAAPGDVDVVLSARRMDRVLEYEPEDLTLVAQAGVTLHAIEAQTREHQQRLGPDPWPGTAGTLGGACAAGRFGLCRLRYGTLRDAVLGARVVHADGATTRTGGKVVKNVTGYDLSKIYIGSQGSLVFIAELNLRLLARPHATALVHTILPFGTARQRLWDLHRGRLQPAAIVVTNAFTANDGEARTVPRHGDSVDLLVRFEGRAPVVEQQAKACKAQLEGRIVAAAREPWQALCAFTTPQPSSTLLQVSAVPTSVLDVVAAARQRLDANVAFVGLFGVGTTWLQSARADAASVRTFYDALPHGWYLRVVDRLETRSYGRAGAAKLQRALKSKFDPHDVLRPAPNVHEEMSL